MLQCKKCGDYYSASEGQANIFKFMGYCPRCRSDMGVIVAVIAVVGLLFFFVWKLPKFIYRKTGKIGLLIYIAVLAGLGFWGYSAIQAKIVAEREAKAKVEMARQAEIEAKKMAEEARELAAKAAKSADLATKKAAEEAALKAKKLTEEAAGIEEVVVQPGTFTDTRDQKTYKTTKIGPQNWLAENLNYKMKNSECHYDKPANCQKYGRRYNWEAAMKACPAGWHLPSYEEWKTLIKATGGDEAGKFLKAVNGWSEQGNGLDTYGFSALPGGYQTSGRSGNAPYHGGWWSASDENTRFKGHAHYFLMNYNEGRVSYDDGTKENLFSVRCVQD